MVTKKQYVTPALKEHGVVREITQSGSGGRKPDLGMSKNPVKIFGPNNNPNKK